MRKYDKDKWDWKIIYFDIPRKQLSSMEKWCIANYDTYNKGYNSTEGGEDNPMNHKLNRDRLSKSMKGNKNGLYNDGIGKAYWKRREYKIITPDNKVIITNNMRKFCRDNKLNDSNMIQVARGTISHCKNYKIEYINQEGLK